MLALCIDLIHILLFLDYERVDQLCLERSWAQPLLLTIATIFMLGEE